MFTGRVVVQSLIKYHVQTDGALFPLWGPWAKSGPCDRHAKNVILTWPTAYVLFTVTVMILWILYMMLVVACYRYYMFVDFYIIIYYILMEKWSINNDPANDIVLRMTPRRADSTCLSTPRDLAASIAGLQRKKTRLVFLEQKFDAICKTMNNISVTHHK